MAMSKEILELVDISAGVVHSPGSSKRALESLTLIDLDVVSSNLPTPPLPPDQAGLNPAKHGNYAQWAAVIVAILLACVNIWVTIYFHRSQSADISSDEHVKQLVQPLIDGASSGINGKLDKIGDKLLDLGEKVAHVQGEVDEANSRAKKISTDQNELKKRVDGQDAILRLQDEPQRIFATIKADIEMADTAGQPLQSTQLVGYKNALRALPTSSEDYWATVASVINYQSKLNQLRGEAPDPGKVARLCIGENFRHNLISGPLRRCVVVLDTETFRNVTFYDSVIIYHGGPVTFEGVDFVNCLFVLEFPVKPTPPVQKNLMFALLDSPDQKTVQVSK
jgi:hypothetical protein